MAWRASYAVLLEIFPQVDARIIKGAALDHGEDLGSAADFILNEVLGPDDDISAQEQHTVTTNETLPSSILLGGPNAGDRLLTESTSDAESYTKISDCELSETANENSFSYANGGPGGGQEAIQGQAPLGSNQSTLGVSSEEEGEAVRPVLCSGSFEFTSVDIDSRPVDEQKTEAPPQLFPESEPGGEDIHSSNLGDSSKGETRDPEDERLAERSVEVNRVEAEISGDGTRELLETCGLDSPDVQGSTETKEKGEHLDEDKEMRESMFLGSTYTDPENSNMEDLNLRECEELEETTRNSVYDSVLVTRSKIEDETVVEEEGLEMMTSTKISFDEEDETEGGCWETVSNSSTQLASMETLLDAVEQAKADKEDLIYCIEELRTLRQKTDQAEYAARVAKDEAEKGGFDIMAQVVEMRQMLSRAREVNEVHAAEVHGEKAVLATEARELRSRLVQLKREKEKALAVLNQIKASLQARIDKACEDCEAALGEKAEKEAIARECLLKEEALMSEVAKESRELQAETETCNLLREFLIERGNIVDALQGEVAVLCEDAEELKEEIERMSLSCSSGFVHMIKPRLLNDSSNSSLSRSSKSVVSGEGVGYFLGCVDQPDSSHEGDVAANSPTRAIAVSQRSASDKRLPSLRRALSGSQDLSGSSHSSVNSVIGVSNSAVSSRSVVKVTTDIGDGNRSPEDKYPSSRSSNCGSEAERKLYQAQIAMFPNEESDLVEYRTSNLDIFRTENSRVTKGARGGSSDEDDWHLLDMTLGSKHASSESSCSSSLGQ